MYDAYEAYIIVRIEELTAELKRWKIFKPMYWYTYGKLVTYNNCLRVYQKLMKGYNNV